MRTTVSVFVCAAAGLLASVALADDRRPDKAHLTVMHFNAEFLWDGEAPEDGSPTVKFEWRGSPEKAAAHMRVVAAIITRNDPDIVSLCEVENKAALDKLNTQFLAGRGYAAYFAQGNDTHTGQDMAVLTRIDPDGGAITYDSRKGTSGDRQKAVSKNYTARFSLNGQKVAIIGAHLLAQPDAHSRRPDRQAQADAVRQMALDAAAAGYQPLVMGDMNDFDSDAACLDRNGNQPITTVLKLLKAMDPSNAKDDLVNVVSLVPRAERYTAFWDKATPGEIEPDTELSQLDHFLVAPGLMGWVKSVVLDHTHDPRQHPDHFPIIVRFMLPPSGDPQPAAVGLRITHLIPNPVGDETINELAMLTNSGPAAVNLLGWKLRDTACNVWILDAAGSIAPGASVVIKRAGQPMSLNNAGDTIELLDAAGAVVHTVRYGRVDPNQVVTVGE